MNAAYMHICIYAYMHICLSESPALLHLIRVLPQLPQIVLIFNENKFPPIKLFTAVFGVVSDHPLFPSFFQNPLDLETRHSANTNNQDMASLTYLSISLLLLPDPQELAHHPCPARGTAVLAFLLWQPLVHDTPMSSLRNAILTALPSQYL